VKSGKQKQSGAKQKHGVGNTQPKQPNATYATTAPSATTSPLIKQKQAVPSINIARASTNMSVSSSPSSSSALGEANSNCAACKGGHKKHTCKKRAGRKGASYLGFFS
jgi:hypothetical protein